MHCLTSLLNWRKICRGSMYADFMINDSLQPDAMQIFLQKTLKLSALINISAPKQIKDSLLTLPV